MAAQWWRGPSDGATAWPQGGKFPSWWARAPPAAYDDGPDLAVGGHREEREKAEKIAKLKKRIGEQQAIIAMLRGEGVSDTDHMLADMITTVQRMQAQIAVLEGPSDKGDPMPAPPAHPAASK